MNNKNIPIGSKVMIEMVFEGYNRDGGKSASFSFGEATPSFGKSHVNLPTDLIKSFEPPAFDWKDVKPGMAFHHENISLNRNEIWFYVGPCWSVKGMIVICNNKNMDCSDQLHFACPESHKLTRAPEHDIEVQP